MMPLMVGTEKRKPVTRPSHRASAIAKHNGAVGTGVTVTMPGSAQPGDLAIFGVVTRYVNSDTPPAGLTKIYDTKDHRKSQNGLGNSVPTNLTVYSRVVQSGDAGSTWNFKSSGSGNQIILATVGVYQGVSHVAVAPKGTLRAGGSRGSSPSVINNLSVGPDNLQVGLIATDGGLNFSSGAALVTSVNPEWTLRQAESINIFLAAALGVALVDSPTHGWLEETGITVSDNDNSIQMVTLELAGPGAKGWFENERVPVSLQGKPVYCYGTSNTNMIPRLDVDPSGGYGGTFNEPKWTTLVSYPDWLISIIDPEGLGNHMGVGGTHACDNVNFAFGTHVNPTQAVTQDLLLTDVAQVNQAGTWTAQTNRDMGGLVLLDIVGNDILWEEAATSQVRDGVRISCETMVRLMRSKHVRNYTYGDTTYTGNWQNQTSDGAVDGFYARTLAAGSYVEFTTTEPVIELLLNVVDAGSSATLNAGAPYSITVNGSQVASGSTNNRFRRGSSSPTPEYGYVQMAIPLELGGGTNTVRVTHTGINGESLRYQGYLVPKTDPNEIPYCVLMGMQKVAPHVFNPGVTQERLDAYLQILHDVADLFPDGKVLVYDPMADGQWSYQGLDTAYGPVGPGAKAFTLDGVHMNMVGHSFFAMDILRFLNERIP